MYAQHTKIWARCLALGLFALCSAANCNRCTDENGARGEPGQAGLSAEQERPLRQITIGVQQEPDTLWAHLYDMTVAAEVLGAGQVYLSTFDEQWQVKPSAALEIPTLENGGVELIDDGTRMRVTWKIDPDLTWPDGVPVTADDFIFAYQLMIAPSANVIDRSGVDKIESMSARGEDRKTLVVVWKQIYAYYHNYRNHPALPKHALADVDVTVGDVRKHVFGTKPMLPGAYTVTEWVRGSHIILGRNPVAKGKWKPWLDRIIFRIIPSTTALEANLIAGTLDAVSSGWLPVDRVEALEREHSDKFSFYYTDGLIFEHVDCNLDNPILADVRVRRALLHGLDRERLLREIVGTRHQIAHSWLPPKRADHNVDVRKYSFDPELAAKLLDEAGYMMGKDGVRAKDGVPLNLSIMSTSGNTMRERIQQFLQSEWSKIGVQLDIQTQPARVFFTETLRRRAFPALALYSWRMDPLDDSAAQWRCDQIPSARNHWSGQNYPGWCNEEVSSIHDRLERSLDQGRRAELLKRQQQLWSDALPALPLFFRVEASITSKKLRGWKPTGTQVPVTWNAVNWRFAE